MGKSKGEKSSGNVSKGIHRNVARSVVRATRAARPGYEKMANIMDAYWKGKNPWITIENPNKEETNKRFIRVKSETLYGSPKSRGTYTIPKSG